MDKCCPTTAWLQSQFFQLPATYYSIRIILHNCICICTCWSIVEMQTKIIWLSIRVLNPGLLGNRQKSLPPARISPSKGFRSATVQIYFSLKVRKYIFPHLSFVRTSAIDSYNCNIAEVRTKLHMPTSDRFRGIRAMVGVGGYFSFLCFGRVKQLYLIVIPGWGVRSVSNQQSLKQLFNAFQWVGVSSAFQGVGDGSVLWMWELSYFSVCSDLFD